MTGLEIIDQAVGLAAASIITACGVAGAAWIRMHVKNQAAAQAASDAVTLAAGVAHDALTVAVANGAPDWAAAKQAAITAGIAAAKQELATDVTPAAVTMALAPLLTTSVAAPTSAPSGTPAAA